MKRLLTFHIESAAELGTEPTSTIRESDLQWLKAINPHTWATPMRDMFPKQKIIARLHGGGSEWDEQEHEWMRQGDAGARLYLDHFAGAIEKSIDEGVYMFEGPNEIHPNGGDNPWDAFVDFQWALAEHYAALNVPYAALSLGVGWMPDSDDGTRKLEDIVRFKDVLLYCAQHGGGLAVHEYGAPSWLSGDGYWTLRIRKSLDALYDAGVMPGAIPVYITECGITRALLGGADLGFRSFSNWAYPAEYGLPEGNMTEERFLLQAQGYERALVAQVPEVEMAAIFGLLPFPTWATFNITTDMVKWVVGRDGYETPMTNAELAEYGQAFIIPLNEDAALYKAAVQVNAGAVAVSPEIYVDGQVIEAFRFPGEPAVQHWFGCPEGEWGNVTHWERAN